MLKEGSAVKIEDLREALAIEVNRQIAPLA